MITVFCSKITSRWDTKLKGMQWMKYCSQYKEKNCKMSKWLENGLSAYFACAALTVKYVNDE